MTEGFRFIQFVCDESKTPALQRIVQYACSRSPAPEEYIIPLTINFPGDKDIDLALMDDAETFRDGFENSYNAIFVQGCHIPRVPRAPGQPAIPETAERIQYRILIRDLWEILGLLFDMRTEP